MSAEKTVIRVRNPLSVTDNGHGQRAWLTASTDTDNGHGSRMLTSWGCILRCGKTVLGSEAGSFREYARDRSDIVEVFIITPKGRVPSARSSSGIPAGFEVKVHLAAEAFGGGTEIVDRYWKLVTVYPDKKLIKHIRTDGSARVEVVKG